MEINRDFIVGLLKSGKYKVEFTKKDGTHREMLCTLNEKYIPESETPIGLGKPKTNDIVSVYDLEKNGWRSFRVNSVKAMAHYE